jgi:hypothetical protein
VSLAAPSRATVPHVPLHHLARLSDGIGLFEHAEWTRPRPEHGYCLDDVARGLLVTVRSADPDAARLTGVYFRFVLGAQAADGAFHNRRDITGAWTDRPVVEDCWGRALWALGTVAAQGPAELAGPALRRFERGATRRCPWPRAMAFAGLGAAEVLRVRPGHPAARALLADAARAVPVRPGDGDWRWPEPRLSYANAVLPEVLIAAGAAAGDGRLLADGLDLLGWLLAYETSEDRLSVTPAGGRAPGRTSARPAAFDQQPIEVAALADACGRAHAVTGEPHWAEAVRRCADWFLGRNDAGVPLYDPVSAGGCDGLQRHGRNENQGAESTLAMLSTFARAHLVGAA